MWNNSESIWDAIEYGCCKRIGHGLSAFDDNKLIDIIPLRGNLAGITHAGKPHRGKIPRY